ncbi:MAG TPA: hypothetical protein DCP61_02885, partial [Treponema sp.]|nr:hypothetical protein [Treponema sp.]
EPVDPIIPRVWPALMSKETSSRILRGSVVEALETTGDFESTSVLVAACPSRASGTALDDGSLYWG